jgi:ABC-type phosphate/phosphonate transport system ATPase subunit
MATDAANALEGWFRYLKQEDFEYLIQYIENIKNGIPNHEMIILFGHGCNGKTTLINEIITHLGDELINEVYDVRELICEEDIRPLVLLREEILHRTTQNYKYIRTFANAVINFINYGVSFIGIAYQLDTVNERILEHSRIIEMTHRFTPNI